MDVGAGSLGYAKGEGREQGEGADFTLWKSQSRHFSKTFLISFYVLLVWGIFPRPPPTTTTIAGKRETGEKERERQDRDTRNKRKKRRRGDFRSCLTLFRGCDVIPGRPPSLLHKSEAEISDYLDGR